MKEMRFFTGSTQNLSVVIPVYNEERNIQLLVARIHQVLKEKGIKYELIFIDDHSTDNSKEVMKFLAKKYAIEVYQKVGKQGKAYSLLEGFSYVNYDVIAMIDADLQYPPEAIPQMLEKLNNGADIVVANRGQQQTGFIRKLTSKGFMYIFGKLLHGLDCDVQSGLKVFKKSILEGLFLNPTPWTFDLEFLVKSKNLGYKIDTAEIIFAQRQFGTSKVNLFQTIWEIGLSAIRTKFTLITIKLLTGKKKKYGFFYKGKEYLSYNLLRPECTAFIRMTKVQLVVFTILIVSLSAEFIFNWRATLIGILALLTLLYFTDILFNFFLIYRSFLKKPEISIEDQEFENSADSQWPIYTILCPLYKEWNVLPQFITAIEHLDYPETKLQVLLLLEADDRETISQAKLLKLPKYVELVIVPVSYPKTKPKACNFGLTQAKGDYIVIYDAEDIPESTQLKKSILAFQKLPANVICTQAKLNFYNPHQNLLTKLFTSEYSLWFDLILTGLQSINAPIPLGGTSNHFKTEDLRNLGGWDAFNVTEDCDLGMRIAKLGYKTAIINSTTQEEANSQSLNWFLQRTRWIKGYIQTYLVHIRDLDEFSKNGNKWNAILFQLIVGGKVLSMFINPLMWIITILYFALRPILGTFIETLFPTPVLYMGVFSLVFGNFLYFYYYMIGCAKRGYYDLIKYGFFVPFYWLAMSLAAWEAVRRLIVQPHYWSKTKHGLHLSANKNIEIYSKKQPVKRTLPGFSV